MYSKRTTRQSFIGTLVLLSGLLVSSARSENDRFKRDTNSDCKDKYKTIPHHTICLEKSSDASNSGVSAEDKIEILERHNILRAIPNATNMLKLEWNDEIATIAQHWADSCNIEHDRGYRRSIPGTFAVGQNLAWNTMTWTQAIQLWYDEVDLFTFGGDNNVFKAVGHYTQLVWADTHRIGCGYADCPGHKYYVCNYGPTGNLGDYTKPYTPGVKCAECPGSCTDNLCVCADPCLNRGTLARDTCTCSCRQNYTFYDASDFCSLDCSTADPEFCSGPVGNMKCSEIERDCPAKCHVCPYSNPGYIEGSIAIETRPDESDGSVIRCDVIAVITMATLLVMTFL